MSDDEYLCDFTGAWERHDVSDWRKDKKWGSRAFSFERTCLGRLWVTGKQDTQLREIETSAVGARNTVVDRLREAYPSILDKWEQRTLSAIMNDQRVMLARYGHETGSTFVACDRIAAKTMQRCAERHKRSMRLVDYDGETPSLRLEAGVTYGKPLALDLADPLAKLGLGDIGPAYLDDYLSATPEAFELRAKLATAGYVEVIRGGVNWWCRVTWVQKREKSNAD